jgi:OCT family organic cation transporter-like MFS transporter 4/5
VDGDWVNLQYWVSAPPILFIAYYWIIPESARWLIAKKRNRKAFKIILNASEANGVELSERILDNFKENEEGEEFKSNIDKSKKAAYMELLRSRIMVIRSLILFFIW